MTRLQAMKWAGTGFQILGVALLSSRLAPPEAAFWVMLIGSNLWLKCGLQIRDPAIIALNVVFCISNVVGIIQWW